MDRRLLGALILGELGLDDVGQEPRALAVDPVDDELLATLEPGRHERDLAAGAVATTPRGPLDLVLHGEEAEAPPPLLDEAGDHGSLPPLGVGLLRSLQGDLLRNCNNGVLLQKKR